MQQTRTPKGADLSSAVRAGEYQRALRPTTNKRRSMVSPANKRVTR